VGVVQILVDEPDQSCAARAEGRDYAAE
jgi:hypothetical protein